MEMFLPGKLTFVLDGGAGSSGKGLRAAYLWKNFAENHTRFAVNTFMSNACHTVFDEHGGEHQYQCLASITHMPDSYEKQYISPGCAFSEKEILDEINKYGMTPAKLGIHPHAVIVTRRDIDYEAGRCDFEGNSKSTMDSPNLRIGSTIHGVGAARARRVLRRPDSRLAKDVPELQSFLCDTSVEIMTRLEAGQSGLMEIAQGYQLSLMGPFWPRSTSRNCSVAASLDDALLPPVVAGPVVVNFRTFPIRVNNNKYIRKSDQKILTWDEYNSTSDNDRELLTGDSGGGYPDQVELTWAEVSIGAGKDIFEKTSLTKLPRRVFSFSQHNLKEALRFNNTGADTFVSVNFMNYVDASVEGKSDIDEVLTPKVMLWLMQHVVIPVATSVKGRPLGYLDFPEGIFIGTWKTLDSSVYVSWTDLVARLMPEY